MDHVVVSPIKERKFKRDVFPDLNLEVRTRALKKRIQEPPARAPIRVEESRAPRRCRRSRESGRSEQEAREHNHGKRSSMNCGHRIPPRCAPRAFLGDKDIGLTSCDLQKRSLGRYRTYSVPREARKERRLWARWIRARFTGGAAEAASPACPCVARRRRRGR